MPLLNKYDIYGDVSAIFGDSTITNPLLMVFIAGFAISFSFFILPKAAGIRKKTPRGPQYWQQ
jgi:hypothetical protein